VSRIVGISRAQLTFFGQAGHAGTTPMNLRADALAAAAEFIVEVESYARRHKGLVATVGQLSVAPGAVNVIPGSATVSLDLRHADDPRRAAARMDLRQLAKEVAATRKVRVDWQSRAETRAIKLSFVGWMTEAARKHQYMLPGMVSGAGHDAAELARITPATMLFVRCKRGISHNPAESVRDGDVARAIAVMCEFLKSLPPAVGPC
jgi:allantoate deiminase